jgi:GDP-L-fucose synthase
MNILLTGGSGFLGTALNQFLHRAGHTVQSLDSKNCDLTKSDSLLKFNHTKWDQIIHLAAWTQAGDFCLKHPGEQWVINQKINTHLLDFWQSQQSQAKLVFMGTSCAYAEGSNLRESEYMDGEPTPSLYTYAMTKRMLYQGARALHQQFGLNYLCFVPSTLYGTGYHTDGRQMHFIFDLIRKIIRGQEYGEPVVLWGNGLQKRELVWLDDFIQMMWALNQRASNDIFNIGAGTEHTIKHFAELICTSVGYDASKIKYDTSRYVGATSKCLNIDKTTSVLKELPQTDLSLGIQKIVAWFYEHSAY